MHLSPLKTKLVGELLFEADSPVHVGSGLPGARRQLITLPDGSVLIPSSTWKGSLRSIAEKLVRSMELNGLEKLAVSCYREKSGGIEYEVGPNVVAEFSKALRGEENALKLGKQQVESALADLGYENKEVREALKNEKRLKRLASDIIALYCPIGRLVGNNKVAGKLRLFDTMLRATEIHVRPGVGIDRATGRAKEDILYFVESLPRGTLIPLRMIVDNVAQCEADSILLGGVLDWIRRLGLPIGARRSSGMGQLRLIVEKSKLYLIELGRDENGLALANPFKNAKRMTLDELISWLSSHR